MCMWDVLWKKNDLSETAVFSWHLDAELNILSIKALQCLSQPEKSVFFMSHQKYCEKSYEATFFSCLHFWSLKIDVKGWADCL